MGYTINVEILEGYDRIWCAGHLHCSTRHESLLGLFFFGRQLGSVLSLRLLCLLSSLSHWL